MSIDARAFLERFLTHESPPVIIGLNDISEEGVVTLDVSVMLYRADTEEFRTMYYYADNPSHHFPWDIQSGMHEIIEVNLKRTVFGSEVILVMNDGEEI